MIDNKELNNRWKEISYYKRIANLKQKILDVELRIQGELKDIKEQVPILKELKKELDKELNE